MMEKLLCLELWKIYFRNRKNSSYDFGYDLFIYKENDINKPLFYKG